MTEPADLVLWNGRIHALAVPDPGDPRTWPGALAPDATDDEPPDSDASAVAVHDGEIVAVGSDRAVRRLAGVETTEVDLDGATLLPGFVDAHTHLVQAGLALVHVDLSTTDDREAALDLLAERAEETAGDAGDGTDESADDAWVIGVRYDESDWTDARHPTRAELDAVAADRPVAAVRVDLHTAVLNSVALERLAERNGGSAVESDDLADSEHVETDDAGAPAGLVTEDAAGVVEPVFDPGRAATERAVRAAIEAATALGITGVHDKVRHSHAPRVYRDLDRAGELDCRVRIDYWADHLDALRELGLRTGDGTALVRVGSLKTFTDGSIGGRTAKLREPYCDADGGGADGEDAGDDVEDASGDVESTGGDAVDPGDDGAAVAGANRGTWVVEPEDLREIVARAEATDLQVQAHAIGDEAIGVAIDALAPAGSRSDDERQRRHRKQRGRHRIEHAELATDDQIERMADAGIVASMQPNFHRWARSAGLYETALGPERTRRSNRLRTMATAGVPLAFGSDGMPMDPLYGIEQAVTAPTAAQSLSVGAALVAYTGGSAYAGFDEGRLGSIEVGKRGDLVALAASPWDEPASIAEIDVEWTVVDGRIVPGDP